MGEPISPSDNLTTEPSLLSIGSATSTASLPSTSSTPSTTSSSEDLNSSTNGPSLSLANPTTSGVPSFRGSTSAPSPLSPQISLQQNTTQMVPLQDDAIVERTLLQPTKGLWESTFIRAHLSDVLILNLFKSNLKKLHLQNCTFDPNGRFVSILKFLM